MRKIRLDSVAAKLVERIGKGEEKTTGGWAKELKVPPSHIRSTLTALRKRGYFFYPVGSITGFNGESKEGKIKDIMNDVMDSRRIIDKYHDNKLEPHMAGMFAIMIESIRHFPTLLPKVQLLMEEALSKVLAAKFEIRRSEEQLKLRDK